MLPTLVNELAAARDRIVLVLDDYHVIADQRIHEGITFLVEHLPPTLHLVLSTRTDPPLPLPRLRVRGELAEIRAEDLRFTRAEASTLLNDVLGLGLEPADVALLQDRAEGWAAGLYLAALSLRGRADAHRFIEAFAGEERHVVDYLGEEVLDRQPEAVRFFLLHTSILDRLCGPVCDAVTGGQGGAAALEELERSNLFLIALDTTRRWYRYHRLFRGLLRHQLDTREPGLATALHQPAYRWHRDEGMIPEAIHHALAAGSVDGAARLVARHWNAFFNEGRLATVAGWLDALGQECVYSDPRLCVARAWIALDLGRVDEVGRWIDAASRGTPPGPIRDASSLESALAVLQLVSGFKRGDIGRASDALWKVLALEPDGTQFGRTVAHILLGVTLYWRGDALRAKSALEDAVALTRQVDNKLGAIYALGYLAVLHAELGELDEAGKVVAEAVFLGEDSGRAEHFVAMMAHLAQGRIDERRGRLAEAEVATARAVELSRRGAGRLEVACALLALARVRHGQGDARQAKELLAQARLVGDSCSDPGILADMLAATQQRLRLAPRAGAWSPRVPEEALSDRELDVLRLMATRLSQREIGASLYLSLNTVKTHARNIFRKLAVSTRAQAVARARELGLV